MKRIPIIIKFIGNKGKILNYFKGLALQQLGKFEDAIQMYNRVLVRDPNDANTY